MVVVSLNLVSFCLYHNSWWIRVIFWPLFFITYIKNSVYEELWSKVTSQALWKRRSCWPGRTWLKLTSHPWWRHQMETISALLVLCEGNSPVTGEFPSQRPVMQSFDIFFDLCLIVLSKQSRRWWFETSSRPLYDAIVMNAPQQKRDECAKFSPDAFWFRRQNHNTTTET